MEQISRRLDLVSPNHAAALLTVLWLLTIAVTWVASGGLS